MKRILVLVAGLVVVVLLGWWIAGVVKKDEQPAPPAQGQAQARGIKPPVAVEAEDVLRAPIREVQQFTGAVSPGFAYLVTPRVAGRVLEISKRIGDPVAEGDLIARIDDSEARQAVLEAEASLRMARASLAETKVQAELAAQDLERIKALEAKKIASRSELDEAMASRESIGSRLRLAQAQIEQREAALATAKIKLAYAVVTAPRAGVVGERFVDEGGMVTSGTPILSIIGIDPVIVQTTVVERLYGQIRAGQPASVALEAYPGREFAGRVARIAPVIQEESRTAQVEIEVANPSRLLKPGMFAKVSIVLSEKSSATVVPTRALVPRNGGTGVFQVDPSLSSVKWIVVKTGISTPEVTEILSPELSGKVVILGQHLLEDGGRVTVR